MLIDFYTCHSNGTVVNVILGDFDLHFLRKGLEMAQKMLNDITNRCLNFILVFQTANDR